MAVTIKDIAREAGVSHPTVSRALREDPQISAATQKKVKEIADRLGYRPNPAMSALIAYRNTIKPAYRLEKLAVLCPSTDEKTFRSHMKEQIAGIRKRAGELGFSPELYAASKQENEQKELSKILYNRGIRGIIVTAMDWSLPAFEWEKFCCVGLAENAARMGLYYVSYDRDEAVEITYAQLRKRGYLNIGYHNTADSEDRNRHLFLSAYMKCRYLDGKPQLAPFLHDKTSLQGISDWIQKNSIDAIISVNAEGLLHEPGLDLPPNLGIACCCAPASSEQEISAYVFDDNKSGILAVDFLQNLIHKNRYGVPRAEDRNSMQLRGYWHEGKTAPFLIKNHKRPQASNKE